MNYSKMSDQDITVEVAKALNLPWTRSCESVVFVADDTAIGRHVFDPCNNPADAWPIITANLMRITPIYGAEVIWLVSRDVHAATDENPLRAAMLVYLQLQEAK